MVEEIQHTKPFNMIIVGMTACGKTKYLLDMLEQDYLGCFEYIFLICPTFKNNKTYREWKYESDEDYIVIPCGQNQVDDWLGYIKNHFENTNSLIILDDCASGNDVKDRTGELVDLGMSGRHALFSTIVITQQLTSISKPFRSNTTKLVTFYNPCKNDMHAIFGDYLGFMDKDEKEDIMKTLKAQKYSRLEISLVHPYDHRVTV